MRGRVLAEEGPKIPCEAGTCLESRLCCRRGLTQVLVLGSVKHAAKWSVHDSQQVDLSLVLRDDACAKVRLIME